MTARTSSVCGSLTFESKLVPKASGWCTSNCPKLETCPVMGCITKENEKFMTAYLNNVGAGWRLLQWNANAISACGDHRLLNKCLLFLIPMTYWAFEMRFSFLSLVACAYKQHWLAITSAPFASSASSCFCHVWCIRWGVGQFLAMPLALNLGGLILLYSRSVASPDMFRSKRERLSQLWRYCCLEMHKQSLWQGIICNAETYSPVYPDTMTPW